jgi:hypothetical protein
LVSFLALLPRTLTTFLFALAALLRFYGNTNTEFLHLTTLGWSLLAFSLGSAALLVNLGLEWNAGNRSRNREDEARQREDEAREREARRDDLADEERSKADRERDRADEERNQANEERERSARRARIQNRWIVLQVQYQVAPGEATRAALKGGVGSGE